MKENTKAMEKALVNVLALTKARRLPDGMFKASIDGKDYFVVTDGYRIVRKYSDVPAVPHTEDTLLSSSVDGFIKSAKKKQEMPLPTVQELKAWIKEKHIRRNNPGKTTFCIDGFVHVNPFFLLDMIQGLPNCKAYRPEKRTSPIYFQSESGDGVLCPVNVPTY
jgi:hypothetical protein